MLGNRGRDTRPELALRQELHRRGHRYRVHVTPLPGVRCKPDLVFGKARVAVFVHGCFWHRCPTHATTPKANAGFWQNKFDANVARDRRNQQALRAAGWTVVVVWEHDDPDEAADRIEALFSHRDS